MSPWWLLLIVPLCAMLWGFLSGFFRGMGYDVGRWLRRRKDSNQESSQS